MTVGQRVKEIRDRLTLKEFVEPLGVTPTQISAIENDKSGLSVELAVKISKAYKVSLDWLLMGIGTEDGNKKESGGKSTIVEDVPAGYVLMPMQEVLDLQRRALEKADQELKHKEDELLEARLAAERLKKY